MINLYKLMLGVGYGFAGYWMLMIFAFVLTHLSTYLNKD